MTYVPGTLAHALLATLWNGELVAHSVGQVPNDVRTIADVAPELVDFESALRIMVKWEDLNLFDDSVRGLRARLRDLLDEGRA